MTFKIFLCEGRIPFLVNEMKEKIKVFETGNDRMTTVEITIDNDFDVLHLFHAGVEAGAESFKKSRLV